MAQIKVILEVKKVSAGGNVIISLDGEPQLEIESDPDTGASRFKPAKVKGKKVKPKIGVGAPFGYLPRDRDADKYATFTLEGDSHVAADSIDGIFREFAEAEQPEPDITVSPTSVYHIESKIFFNDGTPEKSIHRIGSTTDPDELSFVGHWSKKLDKMDFQERERILRKFVDAGLMMY